MHCYEVHVQTTNSTHQTFKSGGKYHDCQNGIVYVIAKDVADAAKKIPEAKVVKYMGRAFGH